MRYHQLLALPFALGLLSATAGLGMAATSGAAERDTAKFGFAAVATAPAAAASLTVLAMDDRPGSIDKPGRVERAERDPADHERPDRGDRPDHARPHR